MPRIGNSNCCVPNCKTGYHSVRKMKKEKRGENPSIFPFQRTRQELTNYPLMWRLTQHEQLEVVSFNVFVRPSNNISVLYITSDDIVYGMGENGYEANILAMEGYHFRCDQVNRPIRVEGLSGKRIKSINVGGVIGAALDEEGLLYWWGEDVVDTYDDVVLPRDAECHNTRFTSFCCGYAMLAATDVKGTVYVWGRYDYGKFKYNYSERITFEQPVVSLSCGFSHLAMVTDGHVYTSGLGTYGQRPGYSLYSVKVGRGRNDDRDTKKEVKLDEPCKSVACGPFSTFFVTDSGKLWACGANCGQHGYLGVTSKDFTIKIPEKVALNKNVKHVLTSSNPLNYCTSIAFTDDGLYSWNGEGLGIPCKVNEDEAHNFISSMCPKNVMIRVQQPSPPKPLSLSMALLGKLEVASKLITDLQLELEKFNKSRDTEDSPNIGI